MIELDKVYKIFYSYFFKETSITQHQKNLILESDVEAKNKNVLDLYCKQDQFNLYFFKGTSTVLHQKILI